MPFLTSIINWLNVKRVHQMDLIRKYPAEVQQETFQKLITGQRIQNGGENMITAHIRSLRDFQQRFPFRPMRR